MMAVAVAVAEVVVVVVVVAVVVTHHKASYLDQEDYFHWIFGHWALENDTAIVAAIGHGGREVRQRGRCCQQRWQSRGISERVRDDPAEQEHSDMVIIAQLIPPVEDAPHCVYAPLPQRVPLCIERPHLLADLQKHADASAPASERNLCVRPDHTTAAAAAIITAALLLMGQPNRHACAVKNKRLVHVHVQNVKFLFGGGACDSWALHATAREGVSEKREVCARQELLVQHQLAVVEDGSFQRHNLNRHALAAADTQRISDGFQKRQRLQLLFSGCCDACCGQSTMLVSS